MSAFLDASVVVAILSNEDDAEILSARVRAVQGTIYVSSIVTYEAVISLARKKAGHGRRLTPGQIDEARATVEVFFEALGAQEVPLAGDVTESAIEASQRYGKLVGHPARLNFGDCFAYACARAKNVPLLYKGADFAKTDIPAA